MSSLLNHLNYSRTHPVSKPDVITFVEETQVSPSIKKIGETELGGTVNLLKGIELRCSSIAWL